MDRRRMFCEKYQDSIICEPSGRTYRQLKEDRVRKIVVIREDVDKLFGGGSGD